MQLSGRFAFKKTGFLPAQTAISLSPGPGLCYTGGMQYDNVQQARFLSRPNRFIALVELPEGQQAVHVKNTGRCRELLLPGARVILTKSANPARKTRYDLIAVEREGQLINIDSQAPNQVAGEYLPALFPQATLIKPEYRMGRSRLDFYIEAPGSKPTLVEVKGVTLLDGEVALFPDAPTLRGVKHLQTLAASVESGYDAWVLFVLQMKGARLLRPNDHTDPAFGKALREAAIAGVQILTVDCMVTPDSMVASQPVPVEL